MADTIKHPLLQCSVSTNSGTSDGNPFVRTQLPKIDIQLVRLFAYDATTSTYRMLECKSLLSRDAALTCSHVLREAIRIRNMNHLNTRNASHGSKSVVFTPFACDMLETNGVFTGSAFMLSETDGRVFASLPASCMIPEEAVHDSVSVLQAFSWDKHNARWNSTEENKTTGLGAAVGRVLHRLCCCFFQ